MATLSPGMVPSAFSRGGHSPETIRTAAANTYIDDNPL
jgi:hypothetical protein